MYLNHKLSASALNVISPLFSPCKSYIGEDDNGRNLVEIVCVCACVHIWVWMWVHVSMCMYVRMRMFRTEQKLERG